MIKITAAPQNGPRFAAGPLALFATEDGKLSAHPFLKAAAKGIAAQAEKELFKGKAGQVVSFNVGSQRYFVVGLGKSKELNLEGFRSAAGKLLKAMEFRAQAAAFALPVDPSGKLAAGDIAMAIAEGSMLASYRYLKYRTLPKDEKPLLTKLSVLVPRDKEGQKAAESGLKKGANRADAVAFVRDLVNDGPSDKKPETLAEVAQGLASNGRISAEVFDKAQLESLGMNAILGVARGSEIEPRLVHLVYKPEGEAKKKIALIGKGITFDSGGLSLKPPQSMETMKMDMAGAATVLAVFKALAKTKPQVEIHGLMPFTYNLPGGDALKPGDILKSYNGKTIEVLNTDAEGRLVLCDAIAYAEKLKFDAIIDLATLTGAVLIALGSSVTGAMSNNKELCDAVCKAGERAGEKIWELPLVSEYKDGIKSKVADLQNISSVRGEAGTIIGGLFLQEFVGDTPWVHLDIAGTAWADRGGSYTSVGGTGALVRTLMEYIEAL